MTKPPTNPTANKPASGSPPTPLTVASVMRSQAAASMAAPAAVPGSQVMTPSGRGSSAAAGSSRVAPTEPISGADALVRSLEALGVDVVFGIPGGAIQPAYDPILRSRVRHIRVRHEQGAGHAATGFAQATGRVGVCIATSGPGATNLVTPIADAYMDSVPLVAITGQVPSGAIGSDAFQEVDIHGITLPITKHNYLVQRAEDVPRVMAEAFHLAGTGRPGPVLVDIPKDVLAEVAAFSWPPTMELPGYRPTLQPHGKQIREAARLIASAQRPVLYVGGGVVKAEASVLLARLAEVTGAPVVTTLMARGAFPDTNPQHLGMPGSHGSVPAVYALRKAELIIALGARFDGHVTGRPEDFGAHATVIHADIDPAEIGKKRAADVPIVGDARYVIEELVTAVLAEHKTGRKADLSSWWQELDAVRARFPLGWPQPAKDTLAPQFVVRRIGELGRAAAGEQAIVVAGVGRHQIMAAQLISYDQPRTWLNSGGLGTMGYAIPAAMGAKIGRPEAVVWAIDGDDCFQMTNQELATCALERVPIKVAIIDNREITEGHQVPDFVQLAQALGCVGLRCDSVDTVDSVIEQALQIDDLPVVVDFVVGGDAFRWPMVGDEASEEDIAFAHQLRPTFDDDELRGWMG